MVVFYIFGILLGSAAGFDTLGLSTGVVESNLQYVDSQPLPIEVKEQPNKRHDQECPQNELLVKILHILTNPQSQYSLDGNTKTYVLSLLENVIQNSPPHYKGMVSNDFLNLRNNPESNAALRDSAVTDKKIKISLHYEIPASNDCQKSLEYLHKIINALNETRTTEILNFEMRTENPERYNTPDNNEVQYNFNNEDKLQGLFDHPKSNVMGLLQNYRPEDSVPVRNEKNDVKLSANIYAPPQQPGLNFVPINYDYNGPKETVLWKNSNAKPFDEADLSLHGNPNGALPKDLLKALLLISQQQPVKSGIDQVKVVENVSPKSKIEIQNLNVVKSSGHLLNPINNQDLNFNQPGGKFENHYVSNVQYADGDQSKQVPLNLAQLQYQPGVNFVTAKQTVNHDDIVEITYVLQEPKQVHYEPVYLIKYRLPLNVFEESVYKLLQLKPYLKQDPNQLYQELLASLKLDKRFTQVTELRSDETHVNKNQDPNKLYRELLASLKLDNRFSQTKVRNDEMDHVNINQSEKASDALRTNAKDIEDELHVIKELNSNMSSSDLLRINDGTVENELNRLKRHPVQNNQN